MSAEWKGTYMFSLKPRSQKFWTPETKPMTREEALVYLEWICSTPDNEPANVSE
jgi:replicative superfamily II helicase